MVWGRAQQRSVYCPTAEAVSTSESPGRGVFERRTVPYTPYVFSEIGPDREIQAGWLPVRPIYGRYFGTVAAVGSAIPQTVWLSGPRSARQKLPITRKRV